MARDMGARGCGKNTIVAWDFIILPVAVGFTLMVGLKA